MTEERDRDLEELIERKVQQRMEQEKEKIREELKQELKDKNEKSSNSQKTEESEGVSRRKFLKGLGALGVGALAASNPVASKMTISSNTIQKDGANIWQGGLFNTNDYLPLDGSGSLNGNLDFGGYNATNISKFDADNFDPEAILEGSDANKPAAGTSGRYYWATDTNILYRDNGNSWTAKAGRGSDGNPVPGTTHLESLSTQSGSVSDAPSNADDIARKAEVDSVGTSLADHENTTTAHGANGGLQGANDVSSSIESHRQNGTHSQPQPPQDHASSHHSGGSDELDAADLSGAKGSADYFLKTDGSSTLWATPPSGAVVASETDDGSDLTEYVVPQSTSPPATLLDVSGDGIFLGGLTFQDDAGSENTTGAGATVTVDGGSSYNVTSIRQTDGNSDDGTIGYIPPIDFQSSLKITVDDWENGNYVSGHGWVKW